MRIAIDGRELIGRPTGVGRYLSRLLEAWSHLPEAAAHDFIVCAPSTGASHAWEPVAPGSRLRAAGRVVRGGGGTWWEQVQLARALRRDSPDVLFAPAYTAPLFVQTPTVLTVHDVSFLAHPEWFPAKTRVRQRIVATSAARRARLVLTDSVFSGEEIVKRIGIPPDRVRVIPLGLTPPPGADRRAPGAAVEPLVLFVGSVFNRRHLPETMLAVAEVARRHPEVRLEIVGDNRTFPHQDLESAARAAGIAGRTAVRSYVTDDILADLYRRAGVFVFLSDYEGFGLTPLEALACSVPIVVGDTRVAREVYGEAAMFVSTTDVPAAAAAVEALLFDSEARRRVLGKAPAVLARYSWPRTARETLAALVEAAGVAR